MLQEADDVLAFKPSRLGHGCYMTDAQVMFLRFAYVLLVLFMFVTCDINQVLMTILFFVTLYQLHFAQQHGLPLEVHAPFSLIFLSPVRLNLTVQATHLPHFTRYQICPTSNLFTTSLPIARHVVAKALPLKM